MSRVRHMSGSILANQRLASLFAAVHPCTARTSELVQRFPCTNDVLTSVCAEGHALQVTARFWHECILNLCVKLRSSSRTLKVSNGQLLRNGRNVRCRMSLSPECIPEAILSPRPASTPWPREPTPGSRGFYLQRRRAHPASPWLVDSLQGGLRRYRAPAHIQLPSARAGGGS